MKQVISNLPLWYKLLCVYAVFSVISFHYLYDGAIKEIEEYNKNVKSENEKGDLDLVYLYVSSFLYPLIVIFTASISILLTLIDIINELIHLVFGILEIILGLFLMLIGFLMGGNKEMNVTTQKKMTKENVLLYEKHDVTTTEALNGENGKTVLIHGVKIFRVIKPVEEGFDVIAQYLAETDSIDLSCLHDYIGWYMVSVDRDNYNHDKFIWNCVTLGEGTENSEIFSIVNPRACTDEEVVMLNELFPEYYEHAF